MFGAYVREVGQYLWRLHNGDHFRARHRHDLNREYRKVSFLALGGRAGPERLGTDAPLTRSQSQPIVGIAIIGLEDRLEEEDAPGDLNRTNPPNLLSSEGVKGSSWNHGGD